MCLMALVYVWLNCILYNFSSNIRATYAINTNSFECRGRFDSDCATCTILLCVSCTSTTAVISLAGTAGTINIGYCSCPIGSFKNTNKCDTCPTGCTACTAATTC